MRFVVALLAPLVVLGLLELALRLCWGGHPTRFFLKTDTGEGYLPNDQYAWQFFARRSAARPDYFLLPAHKAPGTLRVFVLGESAAMGTPDPAFGFSRMLELMLRRQYPDRSFEVFNLAMRGVNSHLIRPIAEECLRHEADALVVYMGNNEAIGLHSPAPGSPLWLQNLTLLRASQALKSTCLGQACATWLAARRKGADTQDDDYFQRQRLAADDPRRALVRRNLEANLDGICRAAVRRGVKVVACTVAVNLRDCPPLGSLHHPALGSAELARWQSAVERADQAAGQNRWTEVSERLSSALRLDPHFAETQFRLAEALAAQGKLAEAAPHYSLARDWDAVPFRTDGLLNEQIRRVGTNYAGRGVVLADVERAFAAQDPNGQGIPGGLLFEDHVHPTFAGNHLLAQLVTPAVVQALGDRLGRPPAMPCPGLSLEECAAALVFTSWDEMNVKAAMVEMLAHPPFTARYDHARRLAAARQDLAARQAALTSPELQRCLDRYHAALRERPSDWRIHYNLAMFYQNLNQPRDAVREMEAVVKLFSRVAPFRLALAGALASAGQRDAALTHLREASRLEPDNPAPRQMLAQLGGR